MRLFVLDDHLLLAQLLAGLLTQRFPLALQGVSGSVAGALPLLAADPPDLLLLDVGLPGEDWSEAAAVYLKANPQGALIIVTGLAEAFERPLWLGTSLLGVVYKSRAWIDLEQIVGRWISSSGLSDGHALQRSIGELSPREQRVFEGLGQGLGNRQIAQMHGLTSSTIDTYRKSICAKLGISGAELVRQAVLSRCLPAVTPMP